MTVPVLMLDSKKKAALDAGFYETFTGLPERYFSAPGRTEISGNHTDHQGGCVLAGAVNLDTLLEVVGFCEILSALFCGIKCRLAYRWRFHFEP